MIKFLFVLVVVWGSLQVEAGTFTLATASVQREMLTLNFTNTGSLSTVTLSGISLKCGGIPPLGWVLKLQGSNWLEINYTWCNALPRYISITAGAVQTSTDSIVAVTNYMVPISNLLALYYFNESQNTSLTLAQHNQQTTRIKNNAPNPSVFGDLIRDTTYTQWSNESVGLDFSVPSSPSINQASRLRSESALNNATFTMLKNATFEMWVRFNPIADTTMAAAGATDVYYYITETYFIVTPTLDLPGNAADWIYPVGPAGKIMFNSVAQIKYNKVGSSYYIPQAINYPGIKATWMTMNLNNIKNVLESVTNQEVYGMGAPVGTPLVAVDPNLVGVTTPSSNLQGFIGTFIYNNSGDPSPGVGYAKVFVNGGQPGYIRSGTNYQCYDDTVCSVQYNNSKTVNSFTYMNNSYLEVCPMFPLSDTISQRTGFRGTILKLAIYSNNQPVEETLQSMYDSVSNSIPVLSGSSPHSTATEDIPLPLTIPSQIFDHDVNTMARSQTLTVCIISLPTKGSLWYQDQKLTTASLPLIPSSSVTFLNDPYSYGTNYASMTVYVSDGIAGSRSFALVIDVTHVNHAPNATSGLSSYVAIGSQVTITLSGTDFDPGDTVTNASITSFPTKGQLYTVGGALIQVLPFYLNGLQVVYKPFANATARTNDSFLFNVSDNHYAWSTAVAYTIVLQFNIQTNNPSGTTYEDQSLPLVFTDTDALNLTSTFVNYIYRLPYHGTLSQTNSTLPYPINNSAPFNYTPNQDFYGVDNFTFFATNGTSYYASDISLFSITVLSTDDIAYFLTDAQLPVRGEVPFDTANFSILWDDVDSDTTTFQVISTCSYGLATNLHADLSQLFFSQGSGSQDPRFKYEGPKFPAIKALWNMSATCGTEGNKTITLSVINEDTTATITRTFFLYCDASGTSTATSSPAWIVALVWIALALLIIMCCTTLIQLSGKVFTMVAGEKAMETDQSVKLNRTSHHFKKRPHNKNWD